MERNRPSLLQMGDTVRLVSPSSTPSVEWVSIMIGGLEDLGLRVEVGQHATDRLGYLAGRDEDRAADFNAALRDQHVRAIIATCGGKGAYRIADRLDFQAAREDPKLFVGFSESVILQLALYRHCGLPCVHGASWMAPLFGGATAESFTKALFSAEAVRIASDDAVDTKPLTTGGKARGVLLGGALDSIATGAGWTLPDFNGAILLLEDVNKGLGHVDRQLTRLLKSGALDGIVGVAVGQFTEFTPSEGWTVIDVLRDRLAPLGIPILGGLPIGHGEGPVAVPVGTQAVLDADEGVLTVEAAGRRSRVA